MTEQEKVIKGLEVIVNDDWMWKKADYYAGICKDALALLKAQEPVEPKWRKGYAYCGQCGWGLYRIVEKTNFCPSCGRSVKWDD